jgi:predicted dehydrogenase
VLKKLRIGVAGAGVFGAHHARKFASHDQAELTGIFDIDEGRADCLAKNLSTKKFESFDDLAIAVDAVVIAAPASCHFDLARRALDSGRHVFVEKPIALNPADADALIELAKSKKLILQVGHQERYVFGAAGLLDQETAPVKIDCVRHAASNGRCEDVSVIFDLMVHDLDLVRKLTGAELSSVRVEGDADEATAELVLTNGTIANVKACRKSASLQRRMKLVYDSGVVEFDFIKREMKNSTPMQLSSGFGDEAGALAFTDPLAFGADLFIESILTGKHPIVNGLDGRAAVDWALKIEQAALLSVEAQGDARQRIRA